MPAGKHTKGKHSAPKGSKKEFEFPRGPQDPEAPDKVEVPEEIAKTAAGKMQTAEHGHDERPEGEAATGASLDAWVEEESTPSSTPDGEGGTRALGKRGRALIVCVIVAALVIVGAVFLAANHRFSETPTQTVQTALEAIKDGDFETFAEVYAGDSSVVEAALENAVATGADLGSESELESRLNDEQKKILAQLTGKVTDFDYTIDSEAVDGDAATVEVTVTSYDLGTFAQDVLGSYIADGLAAAAEGDLESDADASTRFVRVLQDKLGELGGKDKSAQTAFSLVRAEDGSWKLSELTQENLDALTGGLISTTGGMAEQLAAGSGQQ